MEALAERAGNGGAMLAEALADLPVLYGQWIAAERAKLAGLPARRRETAEQLVAEMEIARRRILQGIDIMSRNDIARGAFRYMNLAVAMAAAQRGCERGAGGTAGAGMEAVPARLHPPQHCRAGRSQASRPRDRRPAVLPDRRR
jgi:hypothetical protein